MATAPIPAGPPAVDPNGDGVDVVPVGRRRVAAAVLIDYMAFGVVWALAVRLLAPGPPPPVWIVPPIFLAFEWTLLRHWRTPGVRALVLGRIRVPRPGAPPEAGDVAWVSPAELLRRENGLSMLTGGLFLAEGFHLWATYLGHPNALPPGFRSVPEAALPWGALSLWVGYSFLRLDPRARAVGVSMLLATMAALSFWPETWGWWFAYALAERGAGVGDPMPVAVAEWVRLWFPVAAWLTCGGTALSIMRNHRPFGPPAEAEAPPRGNRPTRYDMAPARAAQVTALVMLFGFLAGWGFTAYAEAYGACQDRDSRRLVETALPRITAEWNPAALAAVAGGDLKRVMETDGGRAAFARYARLGALEAVDEVTGESVIRFLPEGVDVTAHYAVEARFANGPAHIDVVLRRDGRRWTIRNLQVASPILVRRP